MTPADLRAWQASMGYTYDTAAAALGVSRATYARWLAGPGDVPLTTALACAALASGLGPWVPPITPEQAEQAEQAGWALGEYDNDDTACPNCGRFRLCLCPNGKHRCEKCDWSPELGTYAPSFN